MVDGVSDVVELTASDGGDEGGGQFHRIWVVKKRSLDHTISLNVAFWLDNIPNTVNTSKLESNIFFISHISPEPLLGGGVDT
jgi:hypothetical protein